MTIAPTTITACTSDSTVVGPLRVTISCPATVVVELVNSPASAESTPMVPNTARTIRAQFRPRRMKIAKRTSTATNTRPNTAPTTTVAVRMVEKVPGSTPRPAPVAAAVATWRVMAPTWTNASTAPTTPTATEAIQSQKDRVTSRGSVCEGVGPQADGGPSPPGHPCPNWGCWE